MKQTMLFSLFGDADLAEEIAEHRNYEIGDFILRDFPDEETYIKINSDVKDRKVVIIAHLERPNNKCLALLFFAETLRALGAKEIGLITPYLPYMRQDKQFNPGEGITSRYFAALLSRYVDWLITIDPHLHRYHALSEIYSIPTIVLHAADIVVQWIKDNIKNPLLIGPDKESEQWVSDIAQKVGAPFLILEKIREGDRIVKIALPHMEQYKNHTPVLVDDIISTGRTMIETIKHLKELKIKPPICIGNHGIFAENAYESLLAAGSAQIITSNTIKHASNAINLNALIIENIV